MANLGKHHSCYDAGGLRIDGQHDTERSKCGTHGLASLGSKIVASSLLSLLIAFPQHHMTYYVLPPLSLLLFLAPQYMELV